MPSAPSPGTQKKRVTLDSLKARVKVWQEDGITDSKELSKKMQVYLDNSEVVDADGNPVEVQTIYLETGIEDDDSSVTDLNPEMEKSLQSAVSKILEPYAKQLSAFPDRISKALSVTGGAARNDDKKTWGFTSAKEYLECVRKASSPGGETDIRLKASPTTYGQEFVGSDGGFAVPPDYINQIMRDPLGEQSILGMTNVIRLSGNNLTMPTDETTPWQSTGGVQAYWTGEGQTMTQSKPELKQINLNLQKLTVMVPITDEMIQDSSALISYLPQKAYENLDFKLGQSIFTGTGSGMPQGFLNSGTLVTVTKESGQAAATVNVQNVAKMLAAAVNVGDPGYAWFINPSVIPQLLTMTLGNVPAFLPFNAPVSGNVSYPVLGYLFGKPVYATQHCNDLGTAGDIVLANLRQYVSAVKTTGVDSQYSIHLWFDQAITAYRFIFRMAGQTWRQTKITPRTGTFYLSSFVTLQTRS